PLVLQREVRPVGRGLVVVDELQMPDRHACLLLSGAAARLRLEGYPSRASGSPSGRTSGSALQPLPIPLRHRHLVCIARYRYASPHYGAAVVRGPWGWHSRESARNAATAELAGRARGRECGRAGAERYAATGGHAILTRRGAGRERGGRLKDRVEERVLIF